MKKMNRMLSLAASALSSALFFTGCGNAITGMFQTPTQSLTTTESIGEIIGSDIAIDQPLDVAVIVGARQDMNPINASVLLPVMSQIAEYGGNFTVIVSDGAPKLNRIDYSVNPMLGAKDNSYYKLLQQESITLCTQIETMQAKTPDSDILAAVNAAVDTLHAEPNQDILILIDNGISTKGVSMNTLDGFDLEKCYDKMKNELPDLTEIHTAWYGLGETSALYPDGISKQEKQNLQNLWQRLLGSSVVFKGNQITFVNEAVDRSDLPTVRLVNLVDHDYPVPTTIAAEEYSPDTTETVPDAPPAKIIENEPVKLDSGIVAFEPDSFQLKEECLPAIKEYLSGIAESVKYYDQEILLIGSIAYVCDSEDSGVAFSRRRAESVANALIELGVPESKIHIAGAGFADNRITDERDFTEGNKQVAQENRKVLILDVNGDYDETTKAVIRDYLN